MKILKCCYIFCLGAAILIAILGLSTHYWTEVKANINYIEKKNLCVSGYFSNHRYDLNVKNKNYCQFLMINYYYSVDGNLYNSSFIGFFIPINMNIDPPMKAYYLTFIPEISVLKKGADWLLILALLFFAWFFRYVKNLLYKYITNYRD